MVQDTEVSPKKTLAIKFVGVSFESTNYKTGQDELNESLCQGYRIVAEYPTSAGVVFSLSKALRNHERDPRQKLLEDYGDSMSGGFQK